MKKAAVYNLPGFKRSVRSTAKKTPRTPSTAEGASPVLRGYKEETGHSTNTQTSDTQEPACNRMSTEASLAEALREVNKRLDKIDEGLKENASKND